MTSSGPVILHIVSEVMELCDAQYPLQQLELWKNLQVIHRDKGLE